MSIRFIYIVFTHPFSDPCYESSTFRYEHTHTHTLFSPLILLAYTCVRDDYEII